MTKRATVFLRQDPNGNPTFDGFGNTLIVGPELVTSSVDRRSQVQRVRGLDVVDGSQLGGEIEDRGGEPGAAQIAAYSQLSRSSRR